MYKEIRVGLNPDPGYPDDPATKEYYIAVVMGYDVKEGWYNTGVVAHGPTPTMAFQKALELIKE